MCLKMIQDREQCNKDIMIQIIEYLMLAFSIPLVCIVLTGVVENQVVQLILFGIEGASPAMAAIITVLAQDKKIGLKKYLYDRYRANLNAKMCIFGFFVPLSILTGAKVVSIMMGDVHSFFAPITVRKIIIISWALVAEELGWRGYLQEKLDFILPQRYVPFVIGMIWAFWHYHFIVSGSMSVPVAAFAISCVCESYGYYAITKLAKGNIIPASIWHFTGNLMFNLYRFDPHWHSESSKFYWIATIGYALNILLFLWVQHRMKNDK